MHYEPGFVHGGFTSGAAGTRLQYGHRPDASAVEPGTIWRNIRGLCWTADNHAGERRWRWMPTMTRAQEERAERVRTWLLVATVLAGLIALGLFIWWPPTTWLAIAAAAVLGLGAFYAHGWMGARVSDDYLTAVADSSMYAASSGQ